MQHLVLDHHFSSGVLGSVEISLVPVALVYLCCTESEQISSRSQRGPRNRLPGYQSSEPNMFSFDPISTLRGCLPKCLNDDMTRCFSRHCCLRSTASARQSDAHEIASSVLSPLDLALLSPLQSTAPATLKEAHFAQLTICIWHFGIAKTDVYFYLLQDLWLVRALHICTSSRLWRSLFNIEGLPRLFRNVHDFIEMNTHLHHHHLSSSFIIFHHLSTPIFHIYPYLPLGHGLKAPGEPRASLMLAFQVQHVIALVSLVPVPGRKKEGKMKENGQENGA